MLVCALCDGFVNRIERKIKPSYYKVNFFFVMFVKEGEDASTSMIDPLYPMILHVWIQTTLKLLENIMGKNVSMFKISDILA